MRSYQFVGERENKATTKIHASNVQNGEDACGDETKL